MGSAHSASNLQQGWLRKPENGQAIVFIHGFKGSAGSTWASENSSWPDCIISDARFDGAGVFLAEYESKLDSGHYGFEEATRQVFTQLRAGDDASSISACETVLFVGHSAGGIVARNLLVSNFEYFVERRIGLALVGSPSMGSQWADFATSTRALFASIPLFGRRLASVGGVQLEQLTTTSRFLIALDARFKLLMEAHLLKIALCEFVEHRSTIGGAPPVVDRQSASAYSADRAVVIAKSDHSSICRPTSVNDQAHQELVILWNDLLSLPLSSNPVRQSALSNETRHADIRLFGEWTNILSYSVAAEWLRWSPGMPYQHEWLHAMWNLQYRCDQADFIFHDNILQQAHEIHRKHCIAFTGAIASNNESGDIGWGWISKGGQGIRSEINPEIDLYQEAIEEVRAPFEAWCTSYRSFIQTGKSRLQI
jgi:pimeloyl-ACP methyl ester carboxylesterase